MAEPREPPSRLASTSAAPALGGLRASTALRSPSGAAHVRIRCRLVHPQRAVVGRVSRIRAAGSCRSIRIRVSARARSGSPVRFARSEGTSTSWVTPGSSTMTVCTSSRCRASRILRAVVAVQREERRLERARQKPTGCPRMPPRDRGRDERALLEALAPPRAMVPGRMKGMSPRATIHPSAVALAATPRRDGRRPGRARNRSSPRSRSPRSSRMRVRGARRRRDHRERIAQARQEVARALRDERLAVEHRRELVGAEARGKAAAHEQPADLRWHRRRYSGLMPACFTIFSTFALSAASASANSRGPPPTGSMPTTRSRSTVGGSFSTSAHVAGDLVRRSRRACPRGP